MHYLCTSINVFSPLATQPQTSVLLPSSIPWFYKYKRINIIEKRILQGTQRRFPQKYTFQAIQSTCRSLEVHSKRRYKICICSVIVRQLESFRNYKRSVEYLLSAKILDTIIVTYYDGVNFSYSSLHHNFGSENFRLPFFYEKQLSLGS